MQFTKRILLRSDAASIALNDYLVIKRITRALV